MNKYLSLHIFIFKLNILQGLAFSYVGALKIVLLLQQVSYKNNMAVK